MIKSFFLGVVLTIVAIVVVLYFIFTTGTIPAGADSAPLPLEKWAARSSLHATIAAEAPKGPNPVALTDQNLTLGIQLYGQYCAACHGTARGTAATTALAKGLSPRPPQLATHGVEDDPEGETYWKIAHGIRWTAMPSWKATLSEQQMWTVALFLKHMDNLTPAAEQAWQKVAD